MMDETTEGLARIIVQQVGDLIADIARRGVAILLVEQKLSIAMRISHRAANLQHLLLAPRQHASGGIGPHGEVWKHRLRRASKFLPVGLGRSRAAVVVLEVKREGCVMLRLRSYK
jgi:ABC-type polar amino acid transport system ATPase subunit